MNIWRVFWYHTGNGKMMGPATDARNGECRRCAKATVMANEYSHDGKHKVDVAARPSLGYAHHGKPSLVLAGGDREAQFSSVAGPLKLCRPPDVAGPQQLRGDKMMVLRAKCGAWNVAGAGIGVSVSHSGEFVGVSRAGIQHSGIQHSGRRALKTGTVLGLSPNGKREAGFGLGIVRGISWASVVNRLSPSEMRSNSSGTSDTTRARRAVGRSYR